MSALNTRMLSTLISRNLNRSYSRLGVSTDRMSSGLRINKAVDDTAQITVRELLRSNVSVLQQGVRNANDAVSLIQTADAALAVIDEKLIRMKELAEQASTGTYTSTQRVMIDSEFQAMASEINRIATATDYNGIKLLDGSLTGSRTDWLTGLARSIGDTASGELKFHYGLGDKASEDYANLAVPSATTKGLGLNDRTSPPLLSEKLENGAALANFPSGTVSFSIISGGTANVRVHLDDFGVNDTIQIFTTSGKHVAGTTALTADQLRDILTEENGFDRGAVYDGSGLNGIAGGGNLPFSVGDPTADPPTGLNDFIVDGMHIGYSGDGNPGNSNEYLNIDHTTEDLVMVVVGGGQFGVQAKWDGVMPPAQPRDTVASIDTQDKAAEALGRIDDAIKIKDGIRSGLGAMQNRLESTIDHNTRVSEELMASETDLSDIDVSNEMTAFTSSQIVSQIATAMLAQANVLPQRALTLLR